MAANRRVGDAPRGDAAVDHLAVVARIAPDSLGRRTRSLGVPACTYPQQPEQQRWLKVRQRLAELSAGQAIGCPLGRSNSMFADGF